VISRKVKKTLWTMALGMLIAFVGVAVYAWLSGPIGYKISWVGIAIMGVAIVANIAISVSENREK